MTERPAGSAPPHAEAAVAGGTPDGLPAPLRDGSEEPLAHRHDVALLDLDGVLYVGADPVPGAPEAVQAAARAGLRPAYVTNNASRTPSAVAAHLRDLGLPARAEDIVTSAQAAARLVAGLVPTGSAVLVVGGEGLDVALREHGLVPVREAAKARAVVQGFAPGIDWRLLAQGTYAVSAGLPWVASNLDRTVPTADGRAPGNGLLVGVVRDAAGRAPDAVAGKPERPLHEESVRRTGATAPLVVGDRLDTDIEGANRAGTPSLLVLTGVTSPRDLVQAGPDLRPTYIARDLRSGLLEPHPPVRQGAAGWVCRDFTVTHADQGIKISGDGDPLDGLRALCVAVWAAQRRPEDADVAAALSRLGW